MANRSLSIEQILALLAATPQRIAELTDNRSPESLQVKPATDEWSASEVLAHLRACAEVWGDCIRKIIAEDRPMWRAINPRTWINQTNYPELAFRPSFHSFCTQRADLLVVLEPLPHDAWLRAAMVTGAGSPLELTVCPMQCGWPSMNERMSNRLGESSTRCTFSNKAEGKRTDYVLFPC